ncbi:kelch repeat-containing protein, partial [Gemmatimonadota bacterium]
MCNNIEEKVDYYQNNNLLMIAVITLITALTITIPNSLLIAQQTWSQGSPMPTDRHGPTAQVIEGKIYIAGGYNEYMGGVLNTLEVYNPVTDTWSTLASMMTSRESSVSGVVNDKMYVIGGLSGGAISVNEEYDPGQDSWTTKTPMPTGRYFHSADTIDGKIYVVGGWVMGQSDPLSTLEVYDPITDTWETKASMPTARGGGAASVIAGRLYVAGGYNGGAIGALEVYDPATNEWTILPLMSTPRARPSAGSINGELYVVGGGWSGGAMSELEIFDPIAGSWIGGPSIPSARYSAAAQVIGHKMFVAGGMSSSGNYISTLEIFGVDGFQSTRLNLIPASSAQDIPPKTDVAIGFDWPVDASTINASSIRVVAESSGVVSGSYTYVNNINTVFFTPTAAFSAGDSISVTISGAISDTSGAGFDGDNDGNPEGSPADDYIYGFRIGTENPTVTFDSFSNHQTYPTGDISIHYSTGSPGGSYLVTSNWEFSQDGILWGSIDEAAISSNSVQLPGSHTITWSTELGTNNLEGIIDSSAWFRMKVNDGNYYSAYAVSDSFAVDNNLAPSIIISPISGEKTSDIVINYALSDSGQDTLSIVPEFSLDLGDTWNLATVTGDTSVITSDEYSGTLTWLIASDLPPQLDQDDILFRITPSDRYLGAADTLVSIHVDINDPPSIILTDLSGTQVDTVTIQYLLSDASNESLDLFAEYSTDAGATWHNATTSGQTEAIIAANYSGSLKWLSHIDLPSITSVTVQFRITPSDN